MKIKLHSLKINITSCYQHRASQIFINSYVTKVSVIRYEHPLKASIESGIWTGIETGFREFTFHLMRQQHFLSSWPYRSTSVANAASAPALQNRV